MMNMKIILHFQMLHRCISKMQFYMTRVCLRDALMVKTMTEILSNNMRSGTSAVVNITHTDALTPFGSFTTKWVTFLLRLS